MKFREKSTLARRGPVDPLPSEAVDTFLVGDEPIASWAENESCYGHDWVTVYPAWVGGERSFMVRRSWTPAWGYSASGTDEELISFEDGVELLMSHGAYNFTFEK